MLHVFLFIIVIFVHRLCISTVFDVAENMSLIGFPEDDRSVSRADDYGQTGRSS